jgi:nucleoside-diphosphate kinase
MEQTLAIIKPDAVGQKKVGAIIGEIENHGFGIVQIKKVKWKPDDAALFYDVHKTRPFFGELVEFMCSGPIFVLLLEKENAIVDWRELMGNTNPQLAIPGTIRRRFGSSISENAVHGSDSRETAAKEIRFFFGEGR